MTDKKTIFFKGEIIKVTVKKAYWELQFSNGSKEKIYYHVNAQQEAIWMWESGRIDERSQSIGKLIEDL